MPEWSEGYIQANDLNIHYHRTGGAGKTPLILLHLSARLALSSQFFLDIQWAQLPQLWWLPHIQNWCARFCWKTRLSHSRLPRKARETYRHQKLSRLFRVFSVSERCHQKNAWLLLEK